MLSRQTVSGETGRGKPISTAQDIGRGGKIPSASILFPPGQRPGVQAVIALSEARGAFHVSLDPRPSAAPADGEAPETWLELLANGLTFDLVGLAPGAPPEWVPAQHRVGPVGEFNDARLEAITLRPGPHLAPGGTMLPVARGLACLTAHLGALPGSVAVLWHPARCLSDTRLFSEVVLRWGDGGVFPSLGLVALAVEPDGALISEGLGLFVGQELRIEPELSGDREAAAKLAVRLLHGLVERGRLQEAERITGPNGIALRLEPSVNRRFVRVWKAG